MALMFPKELSPLILEDPRRKGEVDTFYALSDLSDEYEVFYDRCVRDGQAVDGYEAPIDFIVLHEKLGMLAIEVKGGDIRINDRGVIEHFYKREKLWHPTDPHLQLKNAFHKLRRAVKSDGASYKIPIKLCVIFPNTRRANLGGKAPDSTLCEDDLKLLPTQIRALYGKPSKIPAWARENFLDMHRRLLTAPQSNRENWGSKSPTTKKSKGSKFFKKKAPQKIEPVSRYDLPKEAEAVITAHNKPAKTSGIPARPPINYNPKNVVNVKATRRTSAEKAKLKWWEIVIAVLISIAVFFIVRAFL